jgi:predicted lipid-binding transport protein (Tim44 family)
MIAAFLVLRLRSILGRRTGFERPPQPMQPVQGTAQPAPGPVIEGRAEPNVASTRAVPEPGSALGQTLQRMRAIDGSFDPRLFLDGAEKAFRIIVGAFARGDRAALRPLLSDETYRGFDQAIGARESLGQEQVTEVKNLETVAIEDADLRGSTATVTVRFVSDQVSFARDKQAHIVSGTDAVTEIVDLWVFERDLGSRDPTWRLVAARSA